MKFTRIIAGFAAVLMLTACQIERKVVYMQNVPTSDTTYVMEIPQDILIRPGDKLSIVVNTDIPEMANVFNLSVAYRYVGGEGYRAGNAQTAYYTVNSDGNINFPVLGDIPVSGLTRMAIADTIRNRLVNENLLKDAVVIIEYGNLTFSVIGDVVSPGRYSFDKDHLTLLEALSMAKDLKITGRRDNVIVTRLESDGSVKTYRVDLRDMDALLKSPAYYVQQNDVIYVEPNKTSARQSTASGNSALTPAFWISVASLLTTITATVTAITRQKGE